MSRLKRIEQKILTSEQAQPVLNLWRFQNKKIVFTNGCFDLLHLGHIHYLVEASELGDKLIVGINSDQSISQLKGKGRPILDQPSRTKILASLFFIDLVIVFEDQTPFHLIEALKPDILVKGADYTPDQIIGANLVLERGGKVETISFVPGYSTSALEKKIKG